MATCPSGSGSGLQNRVHGFDSRRRLPTLSIDTSRDPRGWAMPPSAAVEAGSEHDVIDRVAGQLGRRQSRSVRTWASAAPSSIALKCMSHGAGSRRPARGMSLRNQDDALASEPHGRSRIAQRVGRSIRVGPAMGDASAACAEAVRAREVASMEIASAVPDRGGWTCRTKTCRPDGLEAARPVAALDRGRAGGRDRRGQARHGRGCMLRDPGCNDPSLSNRRSARLLRGGPDRGRRSTTSPARLAAFRAGVAEWQTQPA